jgi:hypothetical protein
LGSNFSKTGDKLPEFDVSNIIYQPGDEPSIILFIAHQDEREAMKKPGLLKELNPA